MIDKLTLLVYPKHNRTACLVMKNINHLFRINHLCGYMEFADELELMCTKIGKGKYHYQSLDLCDKRSGEWAMVCSFSDMEAGIELWDKSIDPKKPVFSWSDTTDGFQAAVADLLKMIR